MLIWSWHTLISAVIVGVDGRAIGPVRSPSKGPEASWRPWPSVANHSGTHGVSARRARLIRGWLRQRWPREAGVVLCQPRRGPPVASCWRVGRVVLLLAADEGLVNLDERPGHPRKARRRVDIAGRLHVRLRMRCAKCHALFGACDIQIAGGVSCARNALEICRYQVQGE